MLFLRIKVAIDLLQMSTNSKNQIYAYRFAEATKKSCLYIKSNACLIAFTVMKKTNLFSCSNFMIAIIGSIYDWFK